MLLISVRHSRVGGNLFEKNKVSNSQPCVYILASRKNGTLYVGVTSNIIQRIYRHKCNLIDGFTKKYGINMLVYYELHSEMTLAIEREKPN